MCARRCCRCHRCRWRTAYFAALPPSAGTIDVKELHIALMYVYDKLNDKARGSKQCGRAVWPVQQSPCCTAGMPPPPLTPRLPASPPPTCTQLPIHFDPPAHDVVQTLMRKHDVDGTGHLDFEARGPRAAVLCRWLACRLPAADVRLCSCCCCPALPPAGVP